MNFQDLWFNDKIRGAFQVITILIITFILVGAGLVLFTPEFVDSDGLTRRVERKISYTGSPINVSTDLSPVSFPECQIQHDLILAIDRSKSMEQDDGLDNSIQAVQRFIDNFDLSNHQIGIVFFSEESVLAQGLTNQPNQLTNALIGVNADGGTDLAKGLETAFTELQSSSSQNLKTIVVLTDAKPSDGLAESDIIDEVRLISNAGVQIFAIGLGDVDKSFITELASDSDYAYPAPSTSELDQIFGEITLQVSSQAATEMTLFEEIDGEKFDILQGSINPASGSATLDGIRWGNLTADYEGLQLEYQLVPKTTGWLLTASQSTPVRFRACDGQVLTLQMDHSGPRILVVPDWLIYLLPLLLLLMVWAFWPRKKPIVYETPTPAPNYILPEFRVDWPTTIANFVPDQISDISTYPTLIIGLGKTGHYGLQLIKKSLLDRGESKLPGDVRLMWIGEEVDKVPTPFNGISLVGEEMRVVDPNLSDIRNRIKDDPKTFSHINWWRSSFSHNSRAFGRVSLFWEFEFDRDPRIINDIKKSSTQLSSSGGKTQLLLLGSLSDKWASAIPELAYLARTHSDGRINQSLAFLSIPQLDSIDSKTDESSRRGAAARELSRFVSGKRQIYHHQNSGRRLSDNFIFDSTFISDQGTHPELTNSSELVIDGIVDQMISLVEREVAVTFWQNHTLDRGVNAVGDARDFYTLVGTINNLNHWWPVEYIRAGIEAHLVKDILLVDTEEGLDSDSFELRKNVLQFLRRQDGKYKQFEQPFRYIADAVEGTWPYVRESVEIPPANLLDGFRWKLILYLNELADNRSRDNAPKLPKDLITLELFLDALKAVLDESEQVLLSYSNEPGNGHVAEHLHSKLPQLLKVITNAKDELQLWTDQFRVRSKTTNTTRGRRFSGSQIDEPDQSNSMGHQIHQTSTQRIHDLEELLSYYDNSYHKKVVLKRSRGVLDFSRDYFDPFLEAAMDNGRSPLDDISERFGWFWDQDKDSRMRLRFAFFPNFNEDSDRSINKFFISRDSINGAWMKDIYAYARILSRSVRTNMDVTDYLVKFDQNAQGVESIKSITDSLDFERGAGDFFKTRHYLFSPNTDFAEKWKRELADDRISVLPTKDPSRLTYLEIYQNLPLSSVKQIRMDLDEGYYPDPELHAYFAEQYAATLENKYGLQGERRFNPRFIRLMENPGLFETAMRCLIYGWIRREKDHEGIPRWSLFIGEEGERINLYGKGIIERETLEDALQDLILVIPLEILDETHPLAKNKIKVTTEAIEKALERRQKALSDNGYEYIESRKKFWKDQLSSSEIRFDRDLLRYLLIIADQELM